jgi:2-polyprenyl-6-methoxyphenol hydroxylase-like FAD-dependent oxidoreductase
MPNHAQVLIAGAGPVGLTLANELIRHGVSVRIVDMAAGRTDKSKALVLWSRSLELFDDAGYVEPFLPAGFEVRGAQISNGKDIIARVTFDSTDSRYDYALMIPQSETERILDERLIQHGLKVERSVELTAFADTGDKVEATLKKADGTTEALTADWLVGCDGAHSTVRHGLNLAFEGNTLPTDWVLGDGPISGLEPNDRLHVFWHRDGILAFFPIIGNRWRVVGDFGVAQSSGRRPDPTLDEINQMMAQRGLPSMVMSDPVWLASFRINERKVKDYSKGRVFLAGDAAHVHSPAGGQGMNTGMQDVFNLAWKLALVIKGSAKATLLDSYSPERTAVGERVLRNAGRMTEVATIRNPMLQGIRNTVARFATSLPFVQHKMANQLSEMDIGYPESPLTVRDGDAGPGPKAGERWPEKLPAGTGGMKFIAVGPADATAALAAKYPQLVVAANAAGAQASGLRLIRPDGYVGYAGSAKDPVHAEAYLAGLAAT